MKGGQGRAILGLKDLMSYLTIFGSTYSFCAPVKGASKTQMMVTKHHGAGEDLQFIIICCATCHVWHAV